MIKVMIYYNDIDARQKNVSKILVLLTNYYYNCFTYYKSETKNHLSIYKSMA